MNDTGENSFYIYLVIKNSIINYFWIHIMYFGHIYLSPNSSQVLSHLLNFM